ncbi:hypothetical protein GOP47_0004284 [Adiantum capillus-veneris]|uniref:Uncharacterized protein n=1 Tax=Adiantum capillus-veneris TaxID=13818 RepID=A0A9D4ZPK6_ADICA|nr:hypothetical protein GOP47_0004284 [Adiantum capillus-veneris]
MASIESVSVEDLALTGIPRALSLELHRQLQGILAHTCGSPAHTWQMICKEILLPSHPFPLHQLLYYSTYQNWDGTKMGPPPVWMPSLETARATNIGQCLERHGRELLGPVYKDPITSFSAFQTFSVDNAKVYWSLLLEELAVKFHVEPECVLDTDNLDECPGGRWLPGATLNVAECCLRAHHARKDEDIALVWRDEGKDDTPAETTTFGELREKVSQVAIALEICGFSKGDAIAIDMPMTIWAVIIYLGIVLSGCVVVSIADSFAACEIQTRLKISDAKGIFTQDIIVRGTKSIPLYTRVMEADGPKAIVLPGSGSELAVALREGDVSWNEFLGKALQTDKSGDYKAVPVSVDAFSNILFSSGTTGEPKAIPWTHLTPLKAAADAWAHHDIRAGDVVSWPTNLGWMMGPWLIYAAFFNNASIALYNGSPIGLGFVKFVQDAKVTMLGLVPSLVKGWKRACNGFDYDWSSIRCFSSSGEASNEDDYLWLMGRAQFKPVLEYCGGTEIGGAFATGSMLQPQALSTFSTPTMGCRLFLLDSGGIPLPPDEAGVGEVALDPIFLGGSKILLNADHYDVYFKGMPCFKGLRLRRHGDEFQRTPRGFYRALGRVDDTMNLGGIKVSSVEIERICNIAHPSVLETAAIGVPEAGGGPEQLLIVVVLKESSDAVSNELLKQKFNATIQQKLNPLFKVASVAVANSLPRTASNKVMRRMLRSQFGTLNKL